MGCYLFGVTFVILSYGICDEHVAPFLLAMVRRGDVNVCDAYTGVCTIADAYKLVECFSVVGA